MEIFREYYSRKSAEVNGQSASIKRSLCETLRTEIAKVPHMSMPEAVRNEHHKLLPEIADGTYPIMQNEDDDEPEEVVEDSSGQQVSGGANESGAQNESLGIMQLLRDIQKGQKDMDKRMSCLERGERPRPQRDELLSSVLHRASGGQIRARHRRTRDNEDAESEDYGEESDYEEQARRRERSRNSRFWRDFEQVRFPVQTLRYEKRVGEKLLRRALECHPTVAAYIGDKVFRQVRNGKESRVIARAVDCMIDDFGVTDVRQSQATEVLMRRLAAIMLADKTGTWDAADELVTEDSDLLDESLKKRIHKSAKLSKEFSKKKPAKEAGEDK